MNSNNLFSDKTESGEWYTQRGRLSDVVLSSRIRIARNLADFPFPNQFRNDDSARVQSLVFDAFLKTKVADSYQTIAVASLQPLGAQMLLERGLVKSSTLKAPGAGLVMRMNGNKANSGLVCTVNDRDHVRISCFTAGSYIEEAYKICAEVDASLQSSLQFAASYDFGFLTSAIKDSGSGVKLSARVHLPSTGMTGKIPELFEALSQKGIVAENAFDYAVTGGGSLGDFYIISSNFSGQASELEQIAAFKEVLKIVVDTERRNNDLILQTQVTEVTDKVLKSFSIGKYALMLDLREAIQIISDIKYGKNLNIIKGISDSELTSLLYRIQEASLRSVIKKRSFKFPMDIAGNDKKMSSRLRSLLLQDSFEHLKIID